MPSIRVKSSTYMRVSLMKEALPITRCKEGSLVYRGEGKEAAQEEGVLEANFDEVILPDCASDPRVRMQRLCATRSPMVQQTEV